MSHQTDFRSLLRDERDAKGKRYTVGKIAEGIYAGRSHVNMVLLNHKAKGRPNFGIKTRQKLVRFFKANFKTWPAMLAALWWDEDGKIVYPPGILLPPPDAVGWDETGKIQPTVPQGTFPGEQSHG